MERLIAVIGPTAVGKTKISIDLAEKLSSEIISGDSMLVYRGMNIGTAKPDTQERRGIPHHLIDIRDPQEDFSVVEFQALAGTLVSKVNAKGKIPILAGGTGLYVKSLLEGYQFNTVNSSEEIRSHFAHIAEQKGSAFLHNKLAEVAPETASKLHPNDLRRIIRALEVHTLSGEKISDKRALTGQPIYDALVICLNMSREKLYMRINERVDIMIENGLVDEVKRLLAEGTTPDAQSMQGIGYKEIVAYLNGQATLPDAINQIKQATRNFAKRQITWFKKMHYITWVEVDNFDDYEKMLGYIYSLVAGKFRPE